MRINGSVNLKISLAPVIEGINPGHMLGEFADGHRGGRDDEPFMSMAVIKKESRLAAVIKRDVLEDGTDKRLERSNWHRFLHVDRILVEWFGR